jgi:hypothetical protein
MQLNLRDIRRLVEDISDEQMIMQPSGMVNHPSWTVGHVLYSLQAIGGELGIEPWLPPEWINSFCQGSIPDIDTQRYPGKKDLLEALQDANERISEKLKNLTDEELNVPLPDEQYRKIFPTLGHAVLCILVSHIGVHIGQLMAWRQVMQLAPVRNVGL